MNALRAILAATALALLGAADRRTAEGAVAGPRHTVPLDVALRAGPRRAQGREHAPGAGHGRLAGVPFHSVVFPEVSTFERTSQ